MDTESGEGARAPAKGKPASPALNMLLLVIAFSWLAILASRGDPRIERWLASSALALVGITGFVGMAIEKRASRRGKGGAGKAR